MEQGLFYAFYAFLRLKTKPFWGRWTKKLSAATLQRMWISRV